MQTRDCDVSFLSFDRLMHRISLGFTKTKAKIPSNIFFFFCLFVCFGVFLLLHQENISTSREIVLSTSMLPSESFHFRRREEKGKQEREDEEVEGEDVERRD